MGEGPPAGPLDDALAERIREIARFLLPYNAVVAVVSREAGLIDLDERKVWRFPAPSPNGKVDADWTELIAQVELLRGRAGFLLIPATAFRWLERHPELQDYLERQCRPALDGEDCLIYAIDAGVREYYAPPDGLPIPPRELVCVVSGVYDPRNFYESGALAVDYMTAILHRAQREPSDLEAILDFGCGCGRVIRHWRQPADTRMCGSDYNPYLIQWCREHLPGEFDVNGLRPPLTYEDESFDLVYAISAFTHFDDALQMSWIAELERVTRPGGLILITVHGLSRIDHLSPEEKRRFFAGELVVTLAEHAGSNLCAAYHPERYVRETLARRLAVLDYLPGAASDAQQDVVLMQKPEPRGFSKRSAERP